ncbi:transketolase [Thalassospiraceae bacterium LMO-JJ14]|nr:transketolase [Thalassospiraceae bacterium LMO-JJ14]
MNVQAAAARQTAVWSEKEMATAIRALAMDAVEAANSGHPGMPMGMADVAAVLFNRFMDIDPTDPAWPDRDRFVLSAGHGSMLLYAIHHLLGYGDMDVEELKNFRQLGRRTAGHPEYGHAAGIETTTGPLGQGVSTAVGMALAERMMNARFGDDLVDHFTYVIAGDGCLMEGISHEAIDLAGHMSLGKLIVLWDDNEISIDGATSISTSTDQLGRFRAAGWHVQAIDGHDYEAIAAAIHTARFDPRPSMIACKTVIGFGAPNKQGTAATHGAPLGKDEIAAARETLGWPYAPFEVPASTVTLWRSIAARGRERRQRWSGRLQASDSQQAFNDALSYKHLNDLNAAICTFKKVMSETTPTVATRKASEMALEVINATLPNTVGGSADLTGSNNTRSSGMTPVSRNDYSGNYIHYGVREHGMAAAMNGIALHGGFIPYGGTFLVFADYCRPAIRLSALMRKRVIYVMTHDSIGLGEDGPTHQPVEHLGSLRLMPNVKVFRPCDAVETAECWALALNDNTGPSVLALSRQNLPTVRTDHTDDNLSAKGGYVLRVASSKPTVTLVATGSEVELAIKARDMLEADGIPATVVSMPCCELFDAMDATYRNTVLPEDAVTVVIEASSADAWARYAGCDGGVIGMHGFGASGPAPLLYEEFGITATAAANLAKYLLAKKGS